MTLDPMAKHVEHLGIRHDFFRLCVFIACCSLLSNVLPHADKLARHPRLQTCYQVLIDFIAFFALNWRVCLPSLDLEMFGFHITRKNEHFPYLHKHRRRRRQPVRG